MAKQPIPGHTKTRLVPPLSADEAAALYRCFLRDKVAQMRQVAQVDRAVAYWPAGGRPFFARMVPDFILLPQQGADLSQRLAHGFQVAFDRGYTQVMAIDGDTPTLPADSLCQGFEALAEPTVDVVVGPCEDGGYYAIGMKAPHLSLFRVTMSTPHVLEDTLAQAAEAGLRVKQLADWHDVDTPADLARLAHELAYEGKEKAPATAQFLHRLRLAGRFSAEIAQ